MTSETKLPSRSSPSSAMMSYEDAWKCVEKTLVNSLYGRPISHVEYMNGYTTVWNIMTYNVRGSSSDEHPGGLRCKLREDFRDFYARHLESTVQPAFYMQTGTDLIRTYLDQKKLFDEAVTFGLRFFKYCDKVYRSSPPDLNQMVSIEWKRVIFDHLMGAEGGLDNALRQEIDRAMDKGDLEARRLMEDMVNSLFTLTFDIAHSVMPLPTLTPKSGVLNLTTEINQAIDQHVKVLSLDQKDPIDWPWTKDSQSLTVLAVYLNKVLASSAPLSSIVLRTEDLKDCKEYIDQIVSKRK